MHYLILVKHAMPEIAAGLPSSQWQLSAEGREAAATLAVHLDPYMPCRMFASSEPKAVQTAQVLSDRAGIEFEIRGDLAEHDRSNVPLLSDEDFASGMAEFFRIPDRCVFGTETADQAYARFASAVDDILGCRPEQNTVVVSHGTVISLFVARHLAIDPYVIWQGLGLPSFISMTLPDFRQTKIVGRVPE
jgi:broad specificity phosphatase PhoE